MATIASLARHDGKAGSNGSWRAKSYPTAQTDDVEIGYREVWHYSTLMLRYEYRSEHGEAPVVRDDSTVYMSTGHGSVSDQGGMNTLFRELGMPYYFSRKGGACIESR